MPDIIYTTEADLTYNVVLRVKDYDVLWDARYDSETLKDVRDKYILELCANLLENFDL